MREATSCMPSTAQRAKDATESAAKAAASTSTSENDILGDEGGRRFVPATPPPPGAVSTLDASIRSAQAAKAHGFISLSPAASSHAFSSDEDEFAEAGVDGTEFDEDQQWKRRKVDSSYSEQSTPVRIKRPGTAPKWFKDQIWGQIELPALCVAVMDTPQFQRLRNLKQLGAACFVFPGASHNRFAHSIGVAHLAGTFVRHLRMAQPELNISDRDIAVVELSGLVHDLGHGPFSHTFDGAFIPRSRPDLAKTGYTHEQMTVRIFAELLSANKINLADYGLDPELDALFVKECILGTKLPGGIAARRGRGPEKFYLYDIVNNVHDGLDVDKLDYYERDTLNTGVRSGCDVKRLVSESRVMRVNAATPMHRIVFPDKLLADVLAAFQTRFRLHHQVYQHKVVKAIELMLVDALLLADKAGVFRFYGKDGKQYSLSGCVDDPSAFAFAQDDVLHQIRMSREPEAEGARALMQRIDRRDLYKSVGEVSVSRSLAVPPPARRAHSDSEATHNLQDSSAPVSLPSEPSNLANLYDLPESKIVELLLQTRTAKAIELRAEEVYCEKLMIHHGSGSLNPLDQVYFFSKANPTHARTLNPSKYENLCPRTFMKEALRIFCRCLDRELEGEDAARDRTLKINIAFLELVAKFDARAAPYLAEAATPVFGNQAKTVEPGKKQLAREHTVVL